MEELLLALAFSINQEITDGNDCIRGCVWVLMYAVIELINQRRGGEFWLLHWPEEVTLCF